MLNVFLLYSNDEQPFYMHNYFESDPTFNRHIQTKDISKLAIVRIFVQSPIAKQIVRTARVTFSDQLANLGMVATVITDITLNWRCHMHFYFQVA